MQLASAKHMVQLMLTRMSLVLQKCGHNLQAINTMIFFLSRPGSITDKFLRIITLRHGPRHKGATEPPKRRHHNNPQLIIKTRYDLDSQQRKRERDFVLNIWHFIWRLKLLKSLKSSHWTEWFYKWSLAFMSALVQKLFKIVINIFDKSYPDPKERQNVQTKDRRSRTRRTTEFLRLQI